MVTSLLSYQSNFPTLHHLIELDLSKNQLQSLPDNFGDLESLTKLDLYGNQLVMLPNSFSQLSRLRWLDVRGNPLQSQLAEAAGTCITQKECKECAANVSVLGVILGLVHILGVVHILGLVHILGVVHILGPVHISRATVMYTCATKNICMCMCDHIDCTYDVLTSLC